MKRETPIGLINRMWFIVLAQNIMCGKNSRQPAILILNPVFLLSITDCVAWGEGVRRGPAPVEGLNEGSKTL